MSGYPITNGEPCIDPRDLLDGRDSPKQRLGLCHTDA
jgi:hypothetical protein